MNEKKKIHQVIVVEGRNDTANLKKYFDCDTIETNGTHLGRDVIAVIQKAQAKRGVIVFTDPDAPGSQIREAVNQAVPGCQNAFIDKKKARTKKKVGVEHAAGEDLEEALEHLIVIDKTKTGLTREDMYELGLSGRENSAALRLKAGNVLHIGYAGAKTFLVRLNCLGITREELERVIQA